MSLHREDFTIAKRWSWLTSVTVSIACDPAAPFVVKLGLSVRAAFATDADLTGAVLRDADLRDADLRGAVLRDAVLRGADLRGADLRDADLTGADLRGADLRGADLTGADLRGADLRGADLRGAVLRGAVLRDADLRGRKIERLIACVCRSDGYTFYGFQMAEGDVMVSAGCQFRSVESYRQHIAEDYPGTDKAAETGRILDYIEGRMEDLGITEPKAKRARKAVAK